MKLAHVEAELASYKQDVQERKRFAPKLYYLTCSWLAAVFLVILLQGFSGGTSHFFSLSNPVLVALLGTTTVNVIGLFYLVAKYLFPTPKHDAKPEKSSD